jgi:hypothetical protein
MAHPLQPVQGVCFANVEDDTVVLDLSTDAYFCLAGLAGHLDIRPDGALLASDAAVVTLLVENGLAQPGASIDRHTAPPLPRPSRTSRSHAVAHPTSREFGDFITSTLHAAVAFPRRGVRQLIGPESDRPPPRPRCDEALIRRAVLFDRWLPWVPFQGQCLYRAYTLRRYLRAADLDAHWVFGVRTWPFAAHCWLQVDDLLLDDDLDRVRLYTPILVA